MRCSLSCPFAVASTSAAVVQQPRASRMRMRIRPACASRVVSMAAGEDNDGGKGGGTGLLERPKFDQAREGGAVSTESGYGAQDVDRRKKLGGGNYRILLLDHEQHTEPLVVKVVTSVVPGIAEDHARNCFRTSKELGMAIVATCLKEHAEFYAQQMYRLGCRTTIEPDSATI